MTVVLHHGDCLQILPTLAAGSVDAVVCDPPYHLAPLVERFGKDDSAPAQHGRDGSMARLSAGFMGKQWDGGDIAFRPDVWRECLRVLRPGGYLAAFGGTRTFWRMAPAMDAAGFTIQDTLCWLYGSGFPKAKWQLKPAWEPILLCRKAGKDKGLDADQGRIAFASDADQAAAAAAAAAQRACQDQNAGRKVLGDFNNGPASLAPYLAKMDKGRWPANVAHDGSAEALEGFPDAPGQSGAVTGLEPSTPHRHVYSGLLGRHESREPRGDLGSAARFFYQAKAGDDDRVDSKHPTVKPVALIRWLVRMLAPPGGTVLDCFAGTGTTGAACIREGRKAILIEREAEYAADIRRRLDMMRGADTPLFAGVSA